jgi:cytochrome c7-like protein/class III cytochrome C family protein
MLKDNSTKTATVKRGQPAKGWALISMLLLSIALLACTAAEAQRVGQRALKKASPSATQKKSPVDYSRFSHRTHVIVEKLSCESCHKIPSKNWKQVRKADEAFPDVTEYPEHKDCLACHRQQFFARERPVPRICSNCHVNATPVETSRYPFPSLGEKFTSSAKGMDFVSDFRVQFPHDKHLDAISKTLNLFDRSVSFVTVSLRHDAFRTEDSEPKSCSVCHQTYQPQGKSDEEFVAKPPKNIGDSFWLKKGSFKSRPTTHAACFTCHNQESELEPLPQKCDACHKLSPSVSSADFDPQLASKMGVDDWWTLTAWRHRFSAGAFRHEVHTDLSCTKCHNPAMNTADVRTLQVPVKSCGGAEGCHVTATADDGGILNYEIDQRRTNQNFVCVKCHIAFGTKPPPASHVEAILKAGTK